MRSPHQYNFIPKGIGFFGKGKTKVSGYREDLERAPKNTPAKFLWSIFGLPVRKVSLIMMRPTSNRRLLQTLGYELA